MACCCSEPPRPLVHEEIKGLTDVASKEMENLCVKWALAQSTRVKVKTPDVVDHHKANVVKLREAAAYAHEVITEATDVGTVQAAATSLFGNLKGKRGAFLDKVTGAADVVTNAAGKGAAAVVSATLETLAKGLEKSIAAIEKPFDEVGKDLIEGNMADILQIYSDYINNYAFSDSVPICRGVAPYGLPEYDSVEADAITKILAKSAEEDLTPKLREKVDAYIKEHAITRAWDAVSDGTRAAYEFVSQYSGLLERIGIERPTFDITDHCVEQTMAGLAVLMAEREGQLRQENANVGAARPKTFSAVFSGKTLTILDLKTMSKE